METHDVVTVDINVVLSTGRSLYYQAPLLKDSASFDEEIFKEVNGGRLYRKRLPLDDYAFPKAAEAHTFAGFS